MFRYWRIGSPRSDQGLGEDRGGGGAVARLVVGPGRDFAQKLAPRFSNLSESSISLATVTPSLVERGAPNELSMTMLRPFGPKVT
jgi:hypothetical protein